MWPPPYFTLGSQNKKGCISKNIFKKLYVKIYFGMNSNILLKK